jgi:hypothetical protein
VYSYGSRGQTEVSCVPDTVHLSRLLLRGPSVLKLALAAMLPLQAE